MKIDKIKIAHIYPSACVMIALVLIALLFYTPLFNHGRVYYKDNLLFSESDNFHTTGAEGTTLQRNKKTKSVFKGFLALKPFIFLKQTVIRNYHFHGA